LIQPRELIVTAPNGKKVRIPIPILVFIVTSDCVIDKTLLFDGRTWKYGGVFLLVKGYFIEKQKLAMRFF
jgi:hypothetical protein